MRSSILIVLLVLSCVLAACQSSRKKEAERQIIPAEKEAPLAKQLDHNLDRAFGSWNDATAERVLLDIVRKVVTSDPLYATEFKGVRVHLLSTETPYVGAGLVNTIYVSRGMVNDVLYESELAFVLATQLALLKAQAPQQRFADLQGQELGESLITLPTTPPIRQADFLAKGWFEPGGLFDYGADTYLKAEREGISLAYAAKFDPRGAVTLIQRAVTASESVPMQALGKILPEPSDRLHAAREEVAKLQPLRDPIVSRSAFEELRNRLSSKKAKLKKKI